MGGAFPDREDLTATLIAEGNKVVIRFLLTATNTQSLLGIPATNDRVGAWEVGLMTFNGDDRLVVFHDADNDGKYSSADTVMDALGRFGWRPYDLPWAEVTLRRCNLQPADGYAFYDHRDYFREYPRNDSRDFGRPPTAGCY